MDVYLVAWRVEQLDLVEAAGRESLRVVMKVASKAVS